MVADHIASSPDDLLARLRDLGVAADTVRHRAVFTVAESAPVKAVIPGAHTKNLFLKDRKGALFLVTAKDDTWIDLKRLHEPLGAGGRLSFASADLMRRHLGVEPGSVTPLAAANDRPPCVRVALDRRLLGFSRVNVHPLVNTMTTGLSPDGLVLFLRSTGHEPLVLDLPHPSDDPEPADVAGPPGGVD